MKEISPIKDRLMQFIKYKGITVQAFERLCGLSNGYVAAIRKGIGSEKLENILTQFPELNRAWLLGRCSEMLRNEQIFDTPSNIASLEAKISNEQDNGHLKQALNDTHSLIECEKKLRQKEEEIMELRLRITQIQEDLLKSQQQFINHLLSKK